MRIFSHLNDLVLYAVTTVILFVVALMTLRLIFNFTDPNPFGNIGRFAYWLKKRTDSMVRPIADWLGAARINTKFAPLVTMLVACVAGYFLLQVVRAVTYMLDGIILSVSTGRFVALVGYLLFGFLALLSLAIFIRIILSWVGLYGNFFVRFLIQVTDPILVPFRRLIPPIGFIDISPMIVLFLLQFLQTAVAGTLIGQ
jgi:YggT family protein